MTAVEDFVAGSTHEWRLELVEGLWGLAVLAPPERLTGELERALDHLSSPDFLLDHIRVLERARIDAELKLNQAAREQRSGQRCGLRVWDELRSG
jgi:hypothetical protein